MLKLLINEIVRPVSARIGTSVGVFLSAHGVAVDNVTVIQAAIPVIIGVAVDLITRKVL